MDQFLPAIFAFLSAGLVAAAVIAFTVCGPRSGFSRLSDSRPRVSLAVWRRVRLR
jgi:hypothetical protein